MSFFRTSTARITFGLLWCLSWLMIAVLLLRPLPFSLPGRTDILGHFLLFATMSLAVFLFARSKAQIKMLAMVTIALGIVLEIGQAYVPSRYFDMVDMIANAIGGLSGGLLASWVFQNWMAHAPEEANP